MGALLRQRPITFLASLCLCLDAPLAASLCSFFFTCSLCLQEQTNPCFVVGESRSRLLWQENRTFYNSGRSFVCVFFSMDFTFRVPETERITSTLIHFSHSRTVNEPCKNGEGESSSVLTEDCVANLESENCLDLCARVCVYDISFFLSFFSEGRREEDFASHLTPPLLNENYVSKLSG